MAIHHLPLNPSFSLFFSQKQKLPPKFNFFSSFLGKTNPVPGTEKMSLPIFLLWLFSIPLPFAQSLPAPRGFLINCGASNTTTSGNLTYVPDDGFTAAGNKTTIKNPDVMPILRDLRFFPDNSARKYCYMIPVSKGGKYLIRTSYFYGGFDGGTVPPVFDQIVDGTKWSTVDTREDYAKGLTSYYELVVAAMGKILSVCLARTPQTVSDPFISVLEVEYLDDSAYNSTDFKKYALGTVARTTFGNNEDDMIGYPDDQYNRYWHPFMDNNPTVGSKSIIEPFSFWNVPPVKAFSTALTTSRGKTLKIQWPQGSLPKSLYYISLYFQDSRTKSPYSWRVFDVSINGNKFYSKLNVTTDGVSVFAAEWPLSGQTEIEMTPGDGVPVGPLINAGEVFQLLPMGGRTLTRDVMAMEDLAETFDNPPSDWSGDPCLPKDHSWTGVTCSDGNLARVVSLNLTGIGLSGTLPSTLGNLTALSTLWLGGNKLSGNIPDMGTMRELKSLHLENNQFEGPIPKSLGELPEIQEIFLQNNKFTGGIPENMRRNGLTIKV
ncbi:probable LRR receptor-like serine/threonine-protein kinase At1g67720 isoform X1 [Punica granatum]|uniref:Probable LRR receptor-like serine/threonine-protein kinase At1g67720 isoform X1 n=2 Tax=Punica granatum TaxID=22663 RepID=A0A6P8CGQ3_PUNGR|nr:probable LRR receptor-like serine/threonine-protein kinase At1g67720 isoform X1 [Punica granatum]